MTSQKDLILGQPPKNIRDEQVIKGILEKMPENVANRFDDEQLSHLLTILGARTWGRHSIDLRGTFKVPFYKWRFYYVFLMGKNHRNLSRKELEVSLISRALIISLIILLCTCVGILVLYLIKSALGIDIFPNFSFGIWGWFKGLFGG